MQKRPNINTNKHMVEKLGHAEVKKSPKSEFLAKLETRWEKGYFVCVGLDSDFSQIPQFIKELWLSNSNTHETMYEFNKEIIGATADLVCAYKLNSSFYEAKGADGLYALASTIRHIKRNYPNIAVILDAKRADIGNSNNGYVEAAFDVLGADAVTVHPYLGKDAMKPFLDRKDKGIIVLVKTSNPGAGEFQDLKVGDKQEPLYKVVARNVAESWNENGNCAVVVGATYPKELAEVRSIVEDMPILIPGIGAQGGEMEATVKAGRDSRKTGMIINSSRGIIFASNRPDFKQAARKATEQLTAEINKYR